MVPHSHLIGITSMAGAMVGSLEGPGDPPEKLLLGTVRRQALSSASGAAGTALASCAGGGLGTVGAAGLAGLGRESVSMEQVTSPPSCTQEPCTVPHPILDTW